MELRRDLFRSLRWVAFCLSLILISLGNPVLKPEFTSSIEGGFELRFFQNRLGMEITGYTVEQQGSSFTGKNF